MGVADLAGRSGERRQCGAGPPWGTPEADERPRTPRALWCLAAFGAVLIHAGCAALAFEYLNPDDVSEELGAPAIEVGLEMLAPRHDESGLPPGPDAEASAASPAIMEQKTAPEETELPKATPTETDDPDRAVTPDDVKKPDDDRKTATVETAPSNPSIAAQAMATPSPETAAAAARSVAPELGTGESLRRVRTTWQKELAAHLDKYKRYPESRKGQSAEIVISFVLDRTGHVVSASVAKSSGDGAFDSAALTMMHRADPVPAPPPLIADETLSFSLPVVFHRHGK